MIEQIPTWVRWLLVAVVLSPLLIPSCVAMGILGWARAWAIGLAGLAAMGALWLAEDERSRKDDASPLWFAGIVFVLVFGMTYAIFLQIGAILAVILGVLLIVSFGKIVEASAHGIRRHTEPWWEPRYPGLRLLLSVCGVVIALVGALGSQDWQAFEAMGQIQQLPWDDGKIGVVQPWAQTCAAWVQGQSVEVWTQAAIVTVLWNLIIGVLDLLGVFDSDVWSWNGYP